MKTNKKTKSSNVDDPFTDWNSYYEKFSEYISRIKPISSESNTRGYLTNYTDDYPKMIDSYPAKYISQKSTKVATKQKNLIKVVKPEVTNPNITQYQPDYLIGFEFEGIVSDETYDMFSRHLLILGCKGGKYLIKAGTDGSIEPPVGYHGIEFRTSALPLQEGFELLEEILCFLYCYSQTNDWKTNSSCGLHVNISEKYIFSSRKQIKLYSRLLKYFDQVALLERFNREDNDFCKIYYGTDMTLKEIEEDYRTRWNNIRDKKYFSIALRDSPEHASYTGKKLKNCRIEFRGMGNTNYHLKFDEIEESINQIVDSFDKMCHELMDGVKNINEIVYQDTNKSYDHEGNEITEEGYLLV